MADDQHLKRQIGLWQLVAYYFSTIVGVGIFIIPVTAARFAGPASIISWLAVLVMVYPFAIIFGNISQKYKVSGSIQRSVEDAFGYRFGKSMALFLIATAIFGNSVLGFYSAQYIMAFLQYNDKGLGIILSIFMMSLSSLFNLLNIETSSRVHGIALLFLIVIIELVAIISIPSYNYDHLVPFMPYGPGSIFLAIIPCFYAVVGWENVDAMAEEVKDPVNTYKKAIKITLFLIAFFYLSLVFTVIFVLTPEQIQSQNTILTILLHNLFGHSGGKVGSIIAIVLLFLGTNVWILGTSRLIFALARDNILPKNLCKINAKTGIPIFAVISQLIVYVMVFGTMLVVDMHEDLIIEIAGLNYIILYIVIFAASIKIFARSTYLKSLGWFSLIASSILLIMNFNYKLFISALIALTCLTYVYFFKRKLKFIE